MICDSVRSDPTSSTVRRLEERDDSVRPESQSYVKEQHIRMFIKSLEVHNRR